MKVLITHKIPETGLDLLKEADIDFVVLKEGAVKKDIIKALKKEAYDGMIVLLTDQIDTSVLDAVGSNMKVIANYAVGYNNIMIDEARERGITVTNTPGVLTETVAEHTVSLICAVSTRVVEADSFLRSGKFKGWEPELFLGVDLNGKKAGILGAGRIGSRVAQILSNGFNMDVLYYDVSPNPSIEKDSGAVRCMSPEEVLRNSDVISVHLPLTPDTHHFLDYKRLKMMKSNAVFVNTSRGSVVCEDSLIEILKNGDIFGAGLDVFENEPDVPKSLMKLNNVILTPHIASASIRTRNLMSKIAATNVVNVLQCGNAINPVN